MEEQLDTDEGGRVRQGDRQQLLILKFVERLSNAEIGVIMGRTEGAIKSLYHRTLNTLRDELAGEADRALAGWEERDDSGLADPEE